jgi:hypothetical protein
MCWVHDGVGTRGSCGAAVSAVYAVRDSAMHRRR